jgi:aspartate kinase
MRPRIVLKFGGKSLSSVDKIHDIKEIIIHFKNSGFDVIAVVSAMGNTTDQLLNLAQSISKAPPKRELDLLVSVGERISMTLLTISLVDAGHLAVSFTGSQSGIITSTAFTDARILEVRPSRIEAALERGHVAVVAGFQGVSIDKEVTTLGRGGSDTTAVALCHALRASKACFFKDVGALFTVNPHRDPSAAPIDCIDYDGALSLLENEDRPLLHLRALALAKKYFVPLEIYATSASKKMYVPGTAIISELPMDASLPTMEDSDAPFNIEAHNPYEK